MGIKRSKADRGSRQRPCAQHGSTKVQSAGEECGRRGEIVGLLRLGKNIRDVVTLIAPGVQIYRSVEDAIRSAENQSVSGKVLGDSETRSEVRLLRVVQSLRITQLAADEDRRSTILENQIRVCALQIVEWVGVLVSQADVHRCGRSDLPSVFRKSAQSPGAQVHLWNSGLTLLYRGQAEEHASET